MWFHEKMMHLADSAADAVQAKMSWWVPCICTSMAASLFIFSQGDIVPQATMILSAIALPHPAAVPFGQRMPTGGPGGDDEDEEDAPLDLEEDA